MGVEKIKITERDKNIREEKKNNIRHILKRIVEEEE